MFDCPICGEPLTWEARICRCARGHTYDRASQGYVNLLRPNRQGNRDPGDNREMVHGRTQFLDSGGYQPLSDALNRTVLTQTAGAARPRVLDLGCGEGYYAARLAQAFCREGRELDLGGVDLSKAAVRHAAGRCKSGRFAVASLFALPVGDGGVDLCYNVFSPLAPQEFARILSPQGRFVAAYPAARHLFGLKQVLYDAPYENPEKTFVLPGFAIRSRERLTFPLALEGQPLIHSLFLMTPYYYRTPAEGARRLEALDRLETEADFWLVTYEKEGPA